MTRMLITKELASMRPFLILLAVMVALTLFDAATSRLADSHADLIRFGDWDWDVEAGFLLVLGFALGSGLIAREQEEGTLAFLDGLPVRRRTVFLTKLGVASTCIFLYALIAPLLAWANVLVLRRSVDVPIEFIALATLLARYALLAIYAVALGLLCGFLRQMSWIVFALLAMGVTLLTLEWPRAGAALNPTALVAEGWATRGWGGDVVVVSSALTLLWLGMGYGLFRSAGGAWLERLAALAQRRALQYGLYALAAALLIAVALISQGNENTEDTEGSGHVDSPVTAASTVAPPKAAATRSTAHYTFKAPAGEKVDPALFAQADAMYRHAAGLLGLGHDQARRIDVDLSGSVAHTSGIAALNRIRMNADGDWADTLAHETVHVLAARLAGAEHNRELDKMALFNEGLAHWAEPSRQRDAEVRAVDDLTVAILMRRGLLSGDMLLTDGGIEHQFDWEMKYPLGAKLIEALVARYGKDAPARVLGALADPDFPRDLKDEGLYRVAFQMAGFDVNLVMFDYAERARTLAQEYAAVIDALPRARGMLVRGADRVGVAIKLDRPIGAAQRLIVRFRPKPDSAVHEYTVVTALDRSAALPVGWLALDRVPGNRVCFQIGVVAHGRTVYEPWNCLPLRVAASRAEMVR